MIYINPEISELIPIVGSDPNAVLLPPVAMPSIPPIPSTASSTALNSITDLKADFALAIGNRDLPAIDTILKMNYQPDRKECAALINLVKRYCDLDRPFSLSLIDILPARILNTVDEATGKTLLHLNTCRIAIAKKLIEKPGIELSVKDTYGSTPLNLSMIMKSEECAMALIENLSIEELNESTNGESYLHCAAYNNLPKAASALLKKGVNAHAKNSPRQTAIMIAIAEEYHLVVEAIVESLSENVALNSPNRPSVIKLHAAILSNNKQTIKTLIDELPANDLRHRNFAGNTPLLSLLLNEHVVSAYSLIEKLKSVPHALCDRDADRGLIPLHVAIRGGSEKGMGLLAFLLIDYLEPSELLDEDNHKATALHWTILCKHPLLANCIIKKNPLTASARDYLGATPLCWAKHRDLKDVIQSLENALKS